MKKHARIEAFISSLDSATPSGLHPCYAGYFTCFNAGDYYEAHDVLEHLWLPCQDASKPFYKGLIQIAGAFVHLRKQFLRPTHPKDGRRLAPASRLFDLGAQNHGPFAPIHLQLDIATVLTLCTRHNTAIRDSDYTINPWNPRILPKLRLLPDTSAGD